MATVTIRRGDLFPVGATVGIYPARAERPGQPPTAAVIASAAVDAAGLLTVTDAGITSYSTFVAYALVDGQHNYARLRSTVDATGAGHTGKRVGTTWPAVVAARRSASGTS